MIRCPLGKLVFYSDRLLRGSWSDRELDAQQASGSSSSRPAIEVMGEESGEKCSVKMVFTIKMVVEWSVVYMSAARPHRARRNACKAAPARNAGWSTWEYAL
jgi:hypothetical protein